MWVLGLGGWRVEGRQLASALARVVSIGRTVWLGLYHGTNELGRAWGGNFNREAKNVKFLASFHLAPKAPWCPEYPFAAFAPSRPSWETKPQETKPTIQILDS